MITFLRVLTWALRAARNMLAVFGCIIAVGRLALMANVSDVRVATIRQALVEAATPFVVDRAPPSGSFFLALNCTDPDKESMVVLQGRAPGVYLQGISKRDATADRCGHGQGVVSIGPCKVDDFVAVDYLTTVLWRTIIVRATTAACGSELTLFRGFGKWYVISRVASCS